MLGIFPKIWVGQQKSRMMGLVPVKRHLVAKLEAGEASAVHNRGNSGKEERVVGVITCCTELSPLVMPC